MNRFVCFAALAAVAIGPSAAFGYSIKKSNSGQELRWDEECVTYYVHNVVPRTLKQQRVVDVVKAAFSSWQTVKTSRLCLQYGGMTSAPFGFDSEKISDNKNTVSFESDSWEYGDDVLAVTTTIYNKKNFTIVDSDIVFNAVNYTWTTEDSDVKTDLQNAATHEIGHFLGLNHSDHTDATMYGTTIHPNETTKRHLADDDRQGISYLYVADDVPTTTSSTTVSEVKTDAPTEQPGNDPVAPNAESNQPKTNVIAQDSGSAGCTVTAAGQRSGGTLLLFLLLFGVATLSRRRNTAL